MAKKNNKVQRKQLKPMLKELKKRFGSHIYATNEATTLEESIVALLKEKNLTLTTAESCTGGMLSARLTNVPGVSEVFKQGFVAYNDSIKRKLLDVKKNTLKTYGAVSEKTAKEMAKNGAFITGSDICVSITGLAGLSISHVHIRMNFASGNFISKETVRRSVSFLRSMP